jgi:uncharacterized protein (DUF2461 family)
LLFRSVTLSVKIYITLRKTAGGGNEAKLHMASSEFSGFEPTLPEFLAQLRENASENWLEQHQAQYDSQCTQPCLNFVRAMTAKVAAFDPPHIAVPVLGGSLRNRKADVVNTSGSHASFLHLVFWAGDEALISPSLHLILSSGGLGFGAGQWQFNQAQLMRYHKALCNEFAVTELVHAIENAKQGGCHLEKPQLKIIPSELSLSGHAKQLSLHTGLVVRNRNEDYHPQMFMPSCVDWVCERLQHLVPLQKWLMQNVYENH